MHQDDLKWGTIPQQGNLITSKIHPKPAEKPKHLVPISINFSPFLSIELYQEKR